MTEEHLQPGWGKPLKATEAHYFAGWQNTLSLCKQWRYRGPRQPEVVPGGTCAICHQKLSDPKGSIET